MNTNPTIHGSRRRTAAALSVLAAAFTATVSRPIAAAPAERAREITLFAFDDVSIPYRRNLRLQMHQPQKHPQNPVLARGEKGSPDDYRAQFYGSVIREGRKFRMWYMAISKEGMQSIPKHAYRGCRAAYAESDDGVHWVKPKLGLVEHNGSRENNLVLIDPPDVTGLHLVLLYEPDDPDPSRRYKMMHQIRWAEAPLFGWTTSVPLFSADGLRWKLETPGAPKDYAISTKDMPLPPEHFEQSGLYKWLGFYYITGQQLSPWVHLPDGVPCGRVMTSFHSADFVHWSAAKTLAFVRDGYAPAPQGNGRESHSPASIWNRGNVLLGLHGQWEGSPKVAERRMPLGLLISNDGLHFREPVAGFVFVPYGKDGEWDQRGLLSGQAFEQVGEQTYIWYGNWDLSAGATGAETYGGVGLLTMRRDGFGSLSPLQENSPAQFVSAILRRADVHSLVVNADGLSAQSRLRIELLDALERPLPGYSGPDAAVMQQCGVQQPVRWPHSPAPPAANTDTRVRITFEGPRREEARFYALYVAAE